MLFEHHANASVPAGYKRDAALYVTAKDGTRIAIEVWLPQDLASGRKIPALIKATPYWRARRLSILGEAAAEYIAPALATEPDVEILNARGYAVIVADARGTGASFGTLKIMFSDAEVSDYGTVADWIAAQPWSNGNVGAYGFSYRGVSAANIASLPNPSIKAVAPLFDLSDVYLLARPGGAYATYLLYTWGKQTKLLNAGIVPCQGDTACEWMIEGPKPVDGEAGPALLKQAIAEHAGNYNVADCAWAAPARDDTICNSGSSLSDVSLIARKAQVEARGLPFFALAGWLDQTSPAQVLYRYKAFSNPQQVVIGPFTHGGFGADDPFALKRPLDLTYKKQTMMMADFFDRYLKPGGTPIASSVHYYVNGAGLWRDSPHWPPDGSVPRKFYPATANTLTETALTPKQEGLDTYLVWFHATTGALSGYRGQVDLSQTDYGDRRAEDSRLLLYTGDPVAQDTEIAGNPVAHLRIGSGVGDGLVIVYLEDVAPKGPVTYVTQGVLKLSHRKLARGAVASADPLHSYLRQDMAPMKGFDDIQIALWPIAARIQKGHALRLAIAGADEDNLERVPEKGTAAITLERGPWTYVEVPIRQ